MVIFSIYMLYRLIKIYLYKIYIYKKYILY